MNAAEEVRRAQQAARAREQRYAAERDQFEADYRARRAARDGFLQNCRPATARDYVRWLTRYLESGGAITHSYDYRMPDDFFVMVSRPGAVPTLYGALSVNVIVPRGLFTMADLPKTFHGGCGHSTFYFDTDPPVAVNNWVPLYTDVAQEITR